MLPITAIWIVFERFVRNATIQRLDRVNVNLSSPHTRVKRVTVWTDPVVILKL